LGKSARLSTTSDTPMMEGVSCICVWYARGLPTNHSLSEFKPNHSPLLPDLIGETDGWEMIAFFWG